MKMREIMTIVSEAGKRSAAGKPVPYRLVQFAGNQKHTSKVVAQKVINVSLKDDINSILIAWMEELGLDPEDEDDLSTVDCQVIE